MGYYTYHTLTVLEGYNDEINHEEEIGKAIDFAEVFDESSKWYDMEIDMKKYSLKHPEVLFSIEGEGEESRDLWKSFFKNGKSFTAKTEIVFEEYNENKLQ